jgi:geranylgeranyl pyrophosphate synthase
VATNKITLMNTFMHVINYALRGASMGIFLVMIFQIFISRKGSYWHIFAGKTAMLFGVLILLLITIRGYTKETSMTALYVIHLIIGFIFFFSLFMTGFTGYKLRKKKASYKKFHSRYAKATFISLLCSVAFGIISYLSHNK